MTVTSGPTTAAALVAHDSSGNISSWSLERRAVGPRDVQFKVCDATMRCHLDAIMQNAFAGLLPFRHPVPPVRHGQHPPATTKHTHTQVTHCGICHSDLHQIKNEWGTLVVYIRIHFACTRVPSPHTPNLIYHITPHSQFHLPHGAWSRGCGRGDCSG